MEDLGQAIGQAFITIAVIAFVVGGAAFWLLSYLWAHVDVSIRWVA